VFAVWLGDAIDGVVGVLFSAMGAWWLASTRRDASSGDLLAEAVFVAGALLLVTLVQRLRAARRVAEEAIRTRDLVLAAVSHDVQTPLTAVLGWSELVQHRMPPDDAAAQDLAAPLSALRDAGRRLQSLVEEITDLAHLGEGSLALHPDAVDLGQLIHTTVDLVRAAETRGVPIKVDVPDNLIITVDPRRLERAVQNVVGNAVKYTVGQEPVYVAAHRAGDEVLVTVRDRGVGIPPHELHKVFARFYRASTAGRVRGTGVGLATTKAIVEAHGGRIDLASTPGVGTMVTIRLPHHRAPDLGQAGPPRPSP